MNPCPNGTGQTIALTLHKKGIFFQELQTVLSVCPIWAPFTLECVGIIRRHSDYSPAAITKQTCDVGKKGAVVPASEWSLCHLRESQLEIDIQWNRFALPRRDSQRGLSHMRKRHSLTQLIPESFSPHITELKLQAHQSFKQQSNASYSLRES